MGRNTTGPPRGAAWCVTLHMQVLQMTATVTSLALYTMCRRTTNKSHM